jgi:hypothetical protein
MRQALDRASSKGEQPKLGGARLGKGVRGAEGKALKDQGLLRQETPEQGALTVAPRGDRRMAGYDETDQDPHATSPLSLATAQAPVQPVAVPDAPSPHVDPAVFAQLMTTLWLRERGKGTKEVRVTFGDDAWPATGARLVRNAAGALDVQLHVADGGALYEGDTLERLTQQLADRGLALGAVSLAEGAVA